MRFIIYKNAIEKWKSQENNILNSIKKMKLTLFEGILETNLKNWKIKNNQLQKRQSNKIYLF